jgi:DNA-binding transcriptional LysR family regulator
MRANNGDVLLKAAIDGLGVLASPTFICHQAIEDKLLKPILCDYKLSNASIYAVYPAQHHLPKRVRILIDFLAENLGDQPYWDNFLNDLK